MSILTDAQKSALFGRLLGIPDAPVNTAVDQYGLPLQACSAGSPERIAPVGTVAGYLPGAFSGGGMNTAILLGVGFVAVLGVVYLAKKVL